MIHYCYVIRKQPSFFPTKIRDATSKGPMNEDSIQKLRQLLMDKTEEVRKLAGQSGGRMFESGSEKLQAVLNAVPGSDEVRAR